MPAKLTYEFVKKVFEAEGYTLLSQKYTNNNQKLDYICTDGHKGSVSYNNFSNRQARCSICSQKKVALQAKHSYEYVRSYFESFGFTLVSKDYNNNRQKLDYMCPKGHTNSIPFCRFKNGNRCPDCCKNKHYSYEEVEQKFKERQYKLITKTYKNGSDKLEYECPEGHNGSIKFYSFVQGSGCLVCGIDKSRKARANSYEQVKKAFEAEGYTLISDSYVRDKDKLGYICPKGHQHSMAYSDFRSGYRCRFCAIENNKGANHSRWSQSLTQEERYKRRSCHEYIHLPRPTRARIAQTNLGDVSGE